MAECMFRVDLSLQSLHFGFCGDSGFYSRTAVGVLDFTREVGEMSVVGTWSCV